KASDVYSLGILFWELSSGVSPFNDISDPTGITLHVINGKREIPVNGTPVDFMNIYCDAWNGDPNLRPSIAEIRDKLKNMRMVPVYLSEKDINITYQEDACFLSTENVMSAKRTTLLKSKVIWQNDIPNRNTYAGN
ncbi:12075_t:CDS:2, partial [Cetraspora pellucida]